MDLQGLTCRQVAFDLQRKNLISGSFHILCPVDFSALNLPICPTSDKKRHSQWLISSVTGGVIYSQQRWASALYNMKLDNRTITHI